MKDPGRKRTWRLRQDKRKKGIYWVLISGRARERASISLKYCTTIEANAALRIMQHEEATTFGGRHYGRILRLARIEPDAAASFLLGDPAALDAFGSVAENPAMLPLQEYVKKHYAPHRAKSRPKTWRTESHDWKRINEYLGGLRLVKINEYSVDDFLERVTKVDGTAATYNMRRKFQNAIRACLTFARRKQHLTGPTPTFFRLEGSTERTHGEPTPYTEEEVFQLLEAASSQKYRAIFAMTIVLGLRPSEALALPYLGHANKHRGAVWSRRPLVGPYVALPRSGCMTSSRRRWPLPSKPLRRVVTARPNSLTSARAFSRGWLGQGPVASPARRRTCSWSAHSRLSGGRSVLFGLGSPSL